MSVMNAVRTVANTKTARQERISAGKAVIVEHAKDVVTSRANLDEIRALRDREAQSCSNSMRGATPAFHDLCDWAEFAYEHHYKVREAAGLPRHQYNCGNDCCTNHPGPVGSWCE